MSMQGQPMPQGQPGGQPGGQQLPPFCPACGTPTPVLQALAQMVQQHVMQQQQQRAPGNGQVDPRVLQMLMQQQQQKPIQGSSPITDVNGANG